MDNSPSIKKIRWKLFLLGLVKIPMIHFVRPRLVAIDANRVEVKVRLRRRTKNHLNSMYFGALAVGADVAAGIHVFYFAEATGDKVSFAFKSMNAQFLMRAETDVTFVCEEGQLIKKAIEQSKQSQERINQIVSINAYNSQNEVVAVIQMEASIKVKE